MIKNRSLLFWVTIWVISMMGNCLDNGLALTPQMGWNSWNHFGFIKETADLLVSSGLAEKGYKYVNIDDCWQISRNPITKQIIEDKEKFPSGMAALAQYVHSKGLLFGLYSDAGTQTCQKRPGGYGYETIDANTYAKWKIDYLKYDNCHNEEIPAKIRFPVMKNALNATKRPILFSMCEWGRQKPYLWAQTVANSWRTTIDIKDIFDSFILNLELNEKLSSYSGPGAWNDPDMLQVGNGGMTNDEYQSHFALWALMKSPLIIGCNIKNMSKQTMNILGNQEVIRINQQPQGKQGSIYSREVHFLGYKEIWHGYLNKYSCAFVFFNRSDRQADFSLDLKNFSKGMKIFSLRQVITHQNVAVPTDFILKVQKVKKHSVAMYRMELYVEQIEQIVEQIEQKVE